MLSKIGKIWTSSHQGRHPPTSRWWAVRAFSNATARENVLTTAAHASRMEGHAILRVIAIVDAVKIMMRPFMERWQRRQERQQRLENNSTIMIRYLFALK